MTSLLFKRLLVLLPSLLILSGLAFGLSQCAPGDPVEKVMPPDYVAGGTTTLRAADLGYTATARQLGKDRPAFYWSITSAARPDTLHRILRKSRRLATLAILNDNGNWPKLQTFYRRVLDRAYAENGDATATIAGRILLADRTATVSNWVSELPANDEIRLAWEDFRTHPQRVRLFLPAVHWHGTDNQYHRWFFGLLGGDFGLSTLDQRPVEEKIWPALRWTALVNGISLLLAYLIALPLGLYTAYYAGTRFDRYTTFVLFLLFSLPGFWVAIMLSNFLTTPAYGLDWFPTIGVGEVAADAGWWPYLTTRVHHLFLPVLCLTYPALAYLTRQMRNAARHELDQAYVKTARLKGLNVHQILWKHVFRNALFPIITLLAGLLPRLLAGSILVELIFYLPGMGVLLIEAVRGSDWSVVLAILMLNGLLTILGILLSDVLYYLADPRLRTGSTQTTAA